MDATDADVFRLYFDRAPDLLCVAGPDGRFRRLNPSWSRVLGWSEAELLARPWLDFVHPDDRPATIEAGRILLAQGEVIDFVNRYACRDGSWRWLSWHSQFLADSGLILATVRDVTEQRRLQHRLDEAERQVAAVLQHAPFGLHLWSIADDGQLRLAAANPAADRFTGVRTADLLGSTIEEAFPDTVRAGLPARYRAVAEGSAPPFELRSLPYSDGIISGHFDVWTFQVGTGRMAALFVEVTERLRAENEIRRSREDLRITS